MKKKHFFESEPIEYKTHLLSDIQYLLNGNEMKNKDQEFSVFSLISHKVIKIVIDLSLIACCYFNSQIPRLKYYMLSVYYTQL